MITPLRSRLSGLRRPAGIAAIAAAVTAAITLTPVGSGAVAGQQLPAAGAVGDQAGAVPAAAAPAAAPTTDDAEQETVVVDETFDGSSLPAGWTTVGGTWSVSDGKLRQTQASGTPMVTFGEHLRDFRFEATLTFDSAVNNARWVSLGLDVNPAGTVPWAQAAMRYVTTAGNGLEFANRLAGGGWSVPDATAAPSSLADHQPVEVSVEVHGTRGTFTFNGQQVLTTTEIRRSDDGVFGLIMDRAAVSFDRVRVTELPPAPLMPLVRAGEPGMTAGHRGNSQGVPENTLPALESAHRIGADFMELDLYMTADNVPIVMHDTTVDRTTDGTGPVGDFTLAEIKELDAGSWFSPAFAGTRVPTFEEALQLAVGNGGMLLPEMKSGWTAEQVGIVVDLVREYGMTDRVIFQSFGVDPLKYAQELGPEIARAGLVSTLPADPVAWTREFGGAALLPNSNLVTADLMQTMHAAGIPVMTWTVDSPAEWERLTELGVDGIMSNTPGELLGWIQRYVQENPPLADVELVAPPVTVRQGRPGADLVVTLSPSAATGTVTAEIDGRSYSGDVVDGSAEIGIPRLARGVYEVPLSYSGDETHAEATGSTTITVVKPGR